MPGPVLAKFEELVLEVELDPDFDEEELEDELELDVEDFLFDPDDVLEPELVGFFDDDGTRATWCVV